MKLSPLPFAAALAAAMPLLAAVAQTSVPVPSPAASASPAAKPEQRNLTPAELRDSATEPGDLRPDRRVTPQVNIPISKNAPPKPAFVPATRGKTGPSGGIDDAAARCSALADATAREQCRDKLAVQGR